MKKRVMSFTLVVLATVLVVQFAEAQIQAVKVIGGEIRGDESRGVSVFKGIPFAAPPIGDLRWKAPQPVIPWTGVRKANSFAPACMQTIGNVTRALKASEDISEDCLYLNVWTAAKSADEKRPVMVYLYGGGFSGGMTSLPLYDGMNFAKKGVVLVSIAYRVGLWGFLAHPDLSRESGKGSGNYGLQDMIAALQWVKENIAQFGGDPRCVTIFGQSAGAMSVSMLAASPPAKGLFHRAISESGGSFAPPRIANEAGQAVPTLPLAEATGKRVLARMGAADINAARSISAKKIMEIPAASAMGLFWPVADGYILPGDQTELYAAGRFNDTPILIGTNSDEGSLSSRNQPVTPQAFEAQIRNSYGSIAEDILRVYPHANSMEAAKSQKDVTRETSFAWHTWTWARLQSFKGVNKAYVYYFDRRNPFTPDGAGHGAEASYVFGNFSGPVAGAGSGDQNLTRNGSIMTCGTPTAGIHKAQKTPFATARNVYTGEIR